MEAIITPELQALLDAAESGDKNGWYSTDRMKLHAALGAYRKSVSPEPFKAWMHRAALDRVAAGRGASDILTFQSTPFAEAWEVEVTPIRRIS